MKPNNQWPLSFRYFVLTLLLILLAALAWSIRDIFQPMLISALVSYLLSPLVSRLSKFSRFTRKKAANIVYFSALFLSLVLLLTVVPVAFTQTQGLVADLNKALDELQIVFSNTYTVGDVSIYLGALLPGIRSSFGGVIVPDPAQALALVETTSRGFLWFLVILVTTYYLMTDWDSLREWLISIAPEQDQPDLVQLYAELRGIWMGYLGGQVRLMMILMLVYTVVWSAIGLPGVLVIGPLAGLLNLLPEVGPFVAAAMAVIIAFIEGSTFLPISNLAFALLTLGVYFVLNNVKTIWIQPRILGQSVYTHEALVFVAIVTAIILWGMLGVLIVVPVLASLSVLGRYFRAKLLGFPPFPDVK